MSVYQLKDQMANQKEKGLGVKANVVNNHNLVHCTVDTVPVFVNFGFY